MSISRVKLESASFVCTVDQHEVSRHGGTDGNLRRLEVANLADHDHVGVLSQDGAERARERVADLRVGLDLRDVRHLVLDPGLLP